MKSETRRNQNLHIARPFINPTLLPKETKDLRKEYWFNYLYREEETGGSSSIRPIEIIKLLNADEYKSSTIPNAGNYIVFRSC